MQDMNDILNPPAEERETTPSEDIATEESQGKQSTDEAAGETASQVAAESDADSGAQTKTELAALAKERERIRQMKASLESERAQLEAERESLTAGKETKKADEAEPGEKEESGGGKADYRSELKELNRKYRTALKDSIMDPDDEDMAKVVEDLEDRMEEVRLAMLSETNRAASEQEKADSAYRATYTALHEEFPFLSPEHPQCDQELIDDINTYMTGRLRQGDSSVAALEKAVRRFAPAYAESTGLAGGGKATDGKEVSGEIARKLSKGGFSEVRSAGGTQHTGPTPMAAILGGKG